MFSNGEYDKFGAGDWIQATCPATMALAAREGCQD